jgi:hypothetical protein
MNVVSREPAFSSRLTERGGKCVPDNLDEDEQRRWGAGQKRRGQDLLLLFKTFCEGATVDRTLQVIADTPRTVGRLRARRKEQV